MSIFEKIQTDMYQAMRDKDTDKSKTLRGVLAKLKDKRIEKREDLTDAEEIKVLQTLAKQRKESIKMFIDGGRNDLVEIRQVRLRYKIGLRCLFIFALQKLRVFQPLLSQVFQGLGGQGQAADVSQTECQHTLE